MTAKKISNTLKKTSSVEVKVGLFKSYIYDDSELTLDKNALKRTIRKNKLDSTDIEKIFYFYLVQLYQVAQEKVSHSDRRQQTFLQKTLKLSKNRFRNFWRFCEYEIAVNNKFINISMTSEKIYTIMKWITFMNVLLNRLTSSMFDEKFTMKSRDWLVECR